MESPLYNTSMVVFSLIFTWLFTSFKNMSLMWPGSKEPPNLILVYNLGHERFHMGPGPEKKPLSPPIFNEIDGEPVIFLINRWNRFTWRIQDCIRYNFQNFHPLIFLNFQSEYFDPPIHNKFKQFRPPPLKRLLA